MTRIQSLTVSWSFPPMLFNVDTVLYNQKHCVAVCQVAECQYMLRKPSHCAKTIEAVLCKWSTDHLIIAFSTTQLVSFYPAQEQGPLPPILPKSPVSYTHLTLPTILLV
eukprot:2305550-Amphidinium_carterae.1